MALNTGQGRLPGGWGITRKLFNYKTGEYDNPYNLVWRRKRKCKASDIKELKEGLPFKPKIDPGTKCGTGDLAYETWVEKNQDKPQYRQYLKL